MFKIFCKGNMFFLSCLSYYIHQTYKKEKKTVLMCTCLSSLKKETLIKFLLTIREKIKIFKAMFFLLFKVMFMVMKQQSKSN